MARPGKARVAYGFSFQPENIEATSQEGIELSYNFANLSFSIFRFFRNDLSGRFHYVSFHESLMF